MRSLLVILACLAVAGGCKNSEPNAVEPTPPSAGAERGEAPDTEASPAAEEGRANTAQPGCEPLPPLADELYQKAESFQVTGPAHSEQRVEARAKKIHLYLVAARAGHIEAQHQAGSMMFGDLYQAEAPRPEQRDEYVQAVMWVMTAAARRKDKDPLASSIGNAKELPAELDGPLAELPREWVEAAFEASREWLACHDPDWDSK